MHTVGLQWRSDQLVAMAATYATPNKHKRRKPVLSPGLEPVIPAIERVQTHTLDRTSTGISSSKVCCWNNVPKISKEVPQHCISLLQVRTYIYIYIYIHPSDNMCIIRRDYGTYRYDDDEARRNICVEQVVSEPPLQHEYYLQTCEISWKTADTTKHSDCSCYWEAKVHVLAIVRTFITYEICCNSGFYAG